eukprot:COSAG01_NODE_6297_length_3749_cov_16.183014_2_plen_70_part_00
MSIAQRLDIDHAGPHHGDDLWQTLTTLRYPAPGCARALLGRAVWPGHRQLRLCEGRIVQCETLGAVVLW